jgi:hypothetical protein
MAKSLLRRTRTPCPPYDDPEWQARKAARRDISHADAVQESIFLQKQFRQLWSSRMAASPVDLNQVLRTLVKKRIPFVLTGAHAIGGWTGRPRDTHDVDILVKAGRNHARAVKALRELYPQLEVHAHIGATGFYMPGEEQSVLDVTYPHRADIQETLENPIWVDNKEIGIRYRIPSLEAALANKYGAMVTVSRDIGKRGLDAVDFMWMVRHSMDQGRQPIDLKKLESLGERVWRGGGKEILGLIEQVKTQGLVDLAALMRKKR